MNTINAVNVNAQKWGPILWSLLNTIAQYSDMYPKSMKRNLHILVSTLPNVLPCGECGKHSKEIYSRLKLADNVSMRIFKKWVWTFKSEVNKYVGAPNITYNEYLTQLKQTEKYMSKKQFIDLLAMISMNYPHENDSDSINRRNEIYLFVEQAIKFIRLVPHLSSLGKFVPSVIWNNKFEFQTWIRFYSKKVYNYDVSFESYM